MKSEMTAINCNYLFRNRKFDIERGLNEIYPKLWTLVPYDKSSGELTRIPRLLFWFQIVRKETEQWDDFKNLSEEIPQHPLIRKLLLRADSVVQAHGLRTCEALERRMGRFSDSTDPCF